jgi:O-antigen/teichoic acid export membrane protein
MNAFRSRFKYGLILATYGILQCFLAIAIVQFFGKYPENVLIGYTFSAIISVILAAYLLPIKPTTNKGSGEALRVKTNVIATLAWKTKLISYTKSFSCLGAISWILLVADRWSLQIFSNNTSEVGVYVAAYQLGYTPVALLCGLGMQLVSPILFKETYIKNNQARINPHGEKIVGICISASLALGFVACLATQPLGKFFLDPSYYKAIILMPYLAIAASLLSAAEFLSLAYQAELRIQILTQSKAILCLAGIILSLIGAKYYGASGVALGFATYSCLQLITLGKLRTKKSELKTDK